MDYLKYCISHMEKVILFGRNSNCLKGKNMWISSFDVESGKPVPKESKKDFLDGRLKNCGIIKGKRVYRNIDAPGGCSLYWDMPLVSACYRISEKSNTPHLKNVADLYVKDFLEYCVAKNGIFLWGNHYYFDIEKESTVTFIGDEEPILCDFSTEEGEYHEMRPISPDWEIFWKISPEKTKNYIYRVAEMHLVDLQSGEFNRHADKRSSCSFLESGGIIVYMLSWLYEKTFDEYLKNTALKIAGFSWKNRGEKTNLVENNPSETRWDKHTCTTESGMWADFLLLSANLLKSEELIKIADAAVSAYLKYSFDEESGRFYGRLNVGSGSPQLGERETPFQPGVYSDIWEWLFPTHDYPMPFSEACVKLYFATGKEIYKQAIDRWVNVIMQDFPPPLEELILTNKVLYAEQYGRCLQFLINAYKALKCESYLKLAHKMAEDAIEKLYCFEMFRGHTSEMVYSSVDGTGFLVNALLELSTL